MPNDWVDTLSAETTDRAPPAESRGIGLKLLVLRDGVNTVSTHVLPPNGEVTIGRSQESDVHLTDASISRRHAVLHIETADGDQVRLAIEDLGSANGTSVSGRRLEANTTTEVKLGEAIDLGSIMLTVQRAALGSRVRRVWSRIDFDARLTEECERARMTDVPFAIVRLSAKEGEDRATVEKALSVFKSFDFVAKLDPKTYGVIAIDVPQGGKTALFERVARHASAVDVNVAIYGDDGRRPNDLMAALGEGAPTAETTSDIVVEDSAMEALYRIIDRVAPSDLAVLILGETGVGKEIMAEAVHRASLRRDHPFIRINCAALSESLVESELFGHEKGAFTGAESAQPGIIESANRGTVLLDEVGELPPLVQSKLLRVIESNEVMRVGGRTPIPVDVRFVSATNRDLEEEIAQRRFRLDLYYRLNGVTLNVPALRERPAEIEPLVHHFATRAHVKAGFPGSPRFTDAAENMLRGYHWPGNVRELVHTVERAVYLAGGEAIDVGHLPAENMRAPVMRTVVPTSSVLQPAPPQPFPAASFSEPTMPADLFVNDEHRAIVVALAECHGNQTRAAKKLGISRGTLVSRLDRYGIARPRKQTPTPGSD
ncbi:MAG: sigma 54-interacting transcriptional regulator [Deltaproteobacteria bacterium]